MSLVDDQLSGPGRVFPTCVCPFLSYFMSNSSESSKLPLVTLLSGGLAGLTVDCILFPLDTIKTRLQSEKGFIASGSFKRIYAGIASTAIGSVPGAAIFFTVYEGTKDLSRSVIQLETGRVLLAASLGETAACLIRVPVEVVKQRTQATGNSSWFHFHRTIASEGIRGLYRGYTTTVSREVPFSLIQFPVWEFSKKVITSDANQPIQPWKSTVAGAFSGALAAFLTTPLDVAKTRVMLAQAGSEMSSGNLFYALNYIWTTKGVKGLFSGAIPRVLWISLGGGIFLGGYELISQTLDKLMQEQREGTSGKVNPPPAV